MKEIKIQQISIIKYLITLVKSLKGKTHKYVIHIVLKILNTIIPSVTKEIIKRYELEIIKKIELTTQIISPLKTLEEIEQSIYQQKKGAFMRFGDGDAYLAVGINDTLQTSNPAISKEMREAFSLKGENIFKSLSIHSHNYGFEKEMYVGNHLVKDELANQLLIFTYPYFVGHKIYSPICLHYAAAYFPERANQFLKILKKHCILFIGNESIPVNTIEILFGSIKHIKTPVQNAFDQISRIEKESTDALEKINKFGIVVVAMGCSGRPLMKRLHNKDYNVFIFDFGSLLDGICGYKTRTWLKKEEINYKLILAGL